MLTNVIHDPANYTNRLKKHFAVHKSKKSSLEYFYSLIDKNGIIQFTHAQNKDYRFGYAIEDQARGLLVSLELHDAKLMTIFLTQLLQARTKNGVFMLKNKFGKLLSQTDNFQEASAEVVWALGQLQAYTQYTHTQEYIDFLATGLTKSHYPRVWAYTLLGLSAAKHTTMIPEFADRLVIAYQKNKSKNWPWFERQMTYANALLPWSLLAAAEVMKNETYHKVGLTSLNFLLENLHTENIPFVVGNQGWWTKNEQPALFDEQPIDVSYLICACAQAFISTQDVRYKEAAFLYYSWFFGNNLAGVSVVDQQGICHDGLSAHGVNQNSGAESTICFLLAQETIMKLSA